MVLKNDKIVVIEDESAIRRVIVLALKTAGYRNVLEEENGVAGYELVERERPQLVLLDIMIPGIDGIEVCRRLRANPITRDIPVIMLTAKSEEHDVVLGLDAGANDYITKPFSKAILLARIRAVLRHPESDVQTLEFDGLTIDDSSHTISLNGVNLSLTLSEYRILELLLSNRNRVFTRLMIIDRISDEQKIVTERTIDVQMVGLRKKLGDWASHIETIRGVGYRIT